VLLHVEQHLLGHGRRIVLCHVSVCGWRNVHQRLLQRCSAGWQLRSLRLSSQQRMHKCRRGLRAHDLRGQRWRRFDDVRAGDVLHRSDQPRVHRVPHWVSAHCHMGRCGRLSECARANCMVCAHCLHSYSGSLVLLPPFIQHHAVNVTLTLPHNVATTSPPPHTRLQGGRTPSSAGLVTRFTSPIGARGSPRCQRPASRQRKPRAATAVETPAVRLPASSWAA
jgi:hypothetical protein